MSKLSQQEGIKRLTEYWFRAQLMHTFLNLLRDEYEDLDTLLDEADWEFRMYLSYWLSGLFVVVEGFNKLKLKDKDVQRLFNENIGALKALRHETYHFAVTEELTTNFIEHLNWAEELHEAIGDYLKKRLGEMTEVERHLAIRAKRKERKTRQRAKKRLPPNA